METFGGRGRASRREPVDLAVITVQGPRSTEVVGERASFPCARLHEAGRDLLAEPDEAEQGTLFDESGEGGEGEDGPEETP